MYNRELPQDAHYPLAHDARPSCADLEMLLLGGSCLDVPLKDAPKSTTLDAQQSPLSNSETRHMWTLEQPYNYNNRVACAVIDAVQMLSNLKILELTFFPAPSILTVADVMPSIQASIPFTHQNL